MFDGWPKLAKPAGSDILSSSNCSAGLLAAAPIDLALISPAANCFNRPLYHYLDALLSAHQPASSLRPLISPAAEAAEAESDTMNFTLDDIKNQVSNLTLYDVKAAVRKAQNVVMNFTEMEAKVREATNNEPWGASSTLMNEIAGGTFNYQQLNEIMPMIYKRFTEKSAEEWRQIYKALQLLEFLVKNGSERVVDDARQHISTVKMLKQFHFIDQNGKDQGLNVRNRAKELAELLADVDKIRAERKKSKSGRGKYQGMEGGAGGSGGGGSSNRYGGFGSDDLEYGGYSGGVYGDGGGFGGQSSSAYADSTTRRPGQYEEYNEFDEGATATTAPPPKKPARPEPQKAAAAPPPKKEPAVDLLFGDEPAPAATTTKAGGSKSAMDDDFGNFKTGNDDDDFDDFISAAPISPPPSSANRAITPLPALTSLPATSTATTFAPKPISASQNQGLQDLVGFKTASPAPSLGSQASSSVAKPLQPMGYQPAQPNYFTSIPLGGANSTVPPAPASAASLSRTNTGASTPTSATPAGAKKGGDAFGNIWNTASLGAGIKKPATPTTPQTSMAAMQKEKASAGIWGAPAAGGNSKPAGNSSSSSSAFDLLG
ncbi:Epsin-2 [Orbilia brochopaga]|nr:Epsin-2 [Drechslerella brochopaga]